MPSFQKSAAFLNIVQKAFDPPPFYLNICPILQGVFFHVVNFLNDAPPYTMARMISSHLKCCINVGSGKPPVENPPASWQAIGPPQKSSKCPFVFGEGGAGSENLI